MKQYTLGLYEKAMPSFLEWPEKLKAAKEAGYDFVEISIDETDEKLARLDMSRDEKLHLIRAGYEAGIPIGTLCLSGNRKYPIGSASAETSKRGVEIMNKAIEFAKDIGVRIIQIAGYDVYYEDSTAETKLRFAENLKILVHNAAKEGVILAFETMETDFMNTVSKAKKYVDFVNSPYLQIYPDSGNITNAAAAYGTDVFEDIKSGASHIVAAHLKESGPDIFRDLMYGQGHVDFDRMIQEFWQQGTRKYVTEFWYLGNENWKADLKFAHDTMSRILEKQPLQE